MTKSTSKAEGWTKVTKSKKVDHNQTGKSATAAQTKDASKAKPNQHSTHLARDKGNKKALLAKNQFFVPPKAATGNAASDKAADKKSEEQQAKKSLKTFLKNQRRNARRRAMKATSAARNESQVQQSEPIDKEILQEDSCLLSLPSGVLIESLLSFLAPRDLVSLSSCSKHSKVLAENGFLWKNLHQKNFPKSQLIPKAPSEWKRAYELSETKLSDRLRCFSTRKTFLEDVLGVGVNFTVNPKTKNVDYVELTQDLLSETAFQTNRIRKDAFGNSFKLFLPLYFTEEHFKRALPAIEKTVYRLCSPSAREGHRYFQPFMVLDVLPKLMNTFTVLLSDEGVFASHKTFDGLIRMHRLFLALVQHYPSIRRDAVRILRAFVVNETRRTKESCPNLGCLVPLLMIVDEKDIEWAKVFGLFINESFDRSVLWCCKKYPALEQIGGEAESPEKIDARITSTLDGMKVNLRLIMFHAYFHRALCKGMTVEQRAHRYDAHLGNLALGKKEEKQSSGPAAANALTFEHFRSEINAILSINSWHGFFGFIGISCPASKADMARRLRQHVKNSRRKKYHTHGMDYARIQASGVSQILSKGQQYSAEAGLRRVVFRDTWSFAGDTKYLDASCLVYKGTKMYKTVDYRHLSCAGIQHSGDVMQGNNGAHTIEIDLEALDNSVSCCYFVISAWDDATLSDILSPSVSFSNAEDNSMLCRYDLDAHDKVSYLTSVIMCRLYQSTDTEGRSRWHVQAIGEAHEGAADRYGPIYNAVDKLLLKK